MSKHVRYPRPSPLAVAAIAALLLLLLPATVAAKAVSVRFVSLPQISAAQAIQLLNRQRAENGIPGDLVLEPRLSRGCRERMSEYKERPGQYPHTEIKGQPGYSMLGSEAAARSELSLGGGAGEWTEISNPWSEAPLHRGGLFAPAGTEAWYGEAANGRAPAFSGGACMGTGGNARTFGGPTFFSVPGGGNPSVPPSERSAEVPFTPAEAAGLPAGAVTGPTIVLYAEGVSAFPQSARLIGPGGQAIPTRLITAATPAPPTHGFPWGPTVGSNYVVVPRPLKPRTPYRLEVDWASGEQSYVQRSSFSTLSQTAAERRTAWGVSCVRLGTCAAGSLHLELVANTVRVSGHPATNQRLFIEIRRGRLSCRGHARPCPNESRFFTADVVKVHRMAFDGHVSVDLPPATSYGSAVEVRAQLGPSKFGGYAWTETNATIFRR